LMASRGLEHGVHQGLGWIPGDVMRVVPEDSALKVPQMGWNALDRVADHPVLAGIEPGAHVYFVHSYKIVPADAAMVLASVDYGGSVAAMVGRDNMVGTQFHPEKSQQTGLRLIENFLDWRP
ncbi:MAG: imidazole glycerol phosphate synthase subunit HisH, partial [Reyranellaceae bacterium]